MENIFHISEEEKMINFVNGFLEVHNLFLCPFTIIPNDSGTVIQTNFVMQKQNGFTYTYIPVDIGDGNYKVLCTYDHLIPTFYDTSEGRNYFPSQNEVYRNIARYPNQKLFRSVNLNIGWRMRLSNYSDNMGISSLNIQTKNFNLSRYQYNHELIEFNEFILHTGFSFTYRKGFSKKLYSARFALSKRTLRMATLGASSSSTDSTSTSAYSVQNSTSLWCPAYSTDNLLEKYPDVIILDTESQITEFLNMLYRAFNIECGNDTQGTSSLEGYKEILCKMKDRELMLKIPIWLVNLIVSK